MSERKEQQKNETINKQTLNKAMVPYLDFQPSNKPALRVVNTNNYALAALFGATESRFRAHAP